MKITELIYTIESTKSFIDAETSLAANDPKFRASGFWQKIFDARKNFPDINEILTFLRIEKEFLIGVGSGSESGVHEQRLWYETILSVILQFTPKDFVRSLDESTFGCPRIFSKDKIAHSAAFVMNSGTCYRILCHLDRFIGNKKLNVCEIGPGYGGLSFQLHARTKISSYLICDLPENLYLSSAYLSSTLSERKLSFVRTTSDAIVKNLAPNTIYVSLPHGINNISAKFDLIINSFSLQEMDRESVDSYIDWIDNHLSEKGLFISFNSHNKAGIKRASQYGFHRFKILYMRPFRKTPPGFFNTIPYEIALSKRDQNTPRYDPVMFDSICELIQLGLDGDIHPLIDDYLFGDLSDDSLQYLLAIHSFFYSKDINEMNNSINRIISVKEFAQINDYLLANYFLVTEKYEKTYFLLCKSLQNGLKDFARTRAIAIANCIRNALPGSRLQGEYHLKEAFELSPNLKNFIRSEQTKNHLGRLVLDTAQKLRLST